MTYKITVPSELIHRAIDAVEQVGYQDKFIDYTFVGAVKNELRAALAEPVPPAGGEPEALPLIHINPAVLGMLRGETKRTAGGLTYSMSSPVGGWTVPLYEQHVVTRLQAEVERLAVTCEGLDEQNDAIALEAGALQSELTKARELLADFAQWYDEPRLARPAVQIRRDIDSFLSNQSAPADKGRGEPVAWMYRREGGECMGQLVQMESDILKVMREGEMGPLQRIMRPREDCIDWKPLYAQQPAQVTVEMPDRLGLNRLEMDRYSRDYRSGWNACLDEVANLNGTLS